MIEKVKKKKFVVVVLNQNDRRCYDMEQKNVDFLVAISIVTILPNDSEKIAGMKIEKELLKTKAHLMDKYYSKKKEGLN